MNSRLRASMQLHERSGFGLGIGLATPIAQGRDISVGTKIHESASPLEQSTSRSETNATTFWESD